MSIVTDAVRAYILPRLNKAEKVVIEAQRAAASHPGYAGFDLALQTIHECTRAVTEEPTRDSVATLRLLDSAQEALTLTTGDAAASVHKAMKLIEEAAVLVRPTPVGTNRH
jgi:hypothetical protein